MKVVYLLLNHPDSFTSSPLNPLQGASPSTTSSNPPLLPATSSKQVVSLWFCYTSYNSVTAGMRMKAAFPLYIVYTYIDNYYRDPVVLFVVDPFL